MSRLPRIRVCKPILGRIPFTTDRGNRASLSTLRTPKTFRSMRTQFRGAKNQRQYLRSHQTLSCSMPSKRGIVHPHRSAKPTVDRRDSAPDRLLMSLERSHSRKTKLPSGWPESPSNSRDLSQAIPATAVLPRSASLANAMRSQDSSGSRRCPRSSVVRVVGLGFQHGFFYESLTAGLLRNSWPYDRKAVVTCQSDRIIIHPSPRLWATQLFPTVSKFLKRKERPLVGCGEDLFSMPVKGSLLTRL